MDAHRAAHDPGIAAEVALPRLVRDDPERLHAGAIVLVGEQPAQHRPRAQ
jgi:hypothetical protein